MNSDEVGSRVLSRMTAIKQRKQAFSVEKERKTRDDVVKNVQGN